MDNGRFDDLTRALGQGRSRRSVVKGLSKGIGAAVIGVGGLRRGNAAANGTCVQFCTTVLRPGPQRGQCVRDAAQGTGLCAACATNPANYCDGVCVDTMSDLNNCGGCDQACVPPAHGVSTCIGGICSVICNGGYQSDGNDGCELCEAEPAATTADVSGFAVPAQLKVACFDGPGDPGSSNNTDDLCPVIEECGVTFVPFSYDDNRVSLAIAAYDRVGTLLGVAEATGTRYAYSATVDATSQTVTFFGQTGSSITRTWAELDDLAGT